MMSSIQAFMHFSKNTHRNIKLLLCASIVLLAGCETVTPYDYTKLQESKPRSILVMPAINNSVEVNAPYTHLSTITKPLAEKGYYVFPVAVIDHFLKENGLPTPAEMNGISLEKIREHIGPDAVLYTTIKNWGQKFQVFNSKTVVDAHLKLIDARTGELLWESSAYAEINSDNGNNNGLLGALISAAINQAIASANDRTPDAARIANGSAINAKKTGLLYGPYVEAPKK